MEWKQAQRMGGGAQGFYQDGEDGYGVTYTQTAPDRGTFTASLRQSVIGSVTVDHSNKEMVREMGRVMRMMCGVHAMASVKRKA